MQAELGIKAAYLLASLTVASITDILRRAIPNTVCIFLALAGLYFCGPIAYMGSLAAIPLLIAAMCRRGSIGGGDIKLMAGVGMLIGPIRALIGLAVGLSLLVLYSKTKETENPDEAKCTPSLPMAPFLSMGVIAAYFI